MTAQAYNISINGKDKTSRAFASLNKNIKQSSKAMAGVVKKMAKAGAAMATAATGAGVALTKSSMTSIDNLAKTADKLGATTEALVGLQHAAELTGVGTETMNMALQRMTRRVAEAAIGTGEAKGALAELNLNAVELQKLPLDVQMQKIAQQMGQVENQSDRVRLAMKLFDSEGVALVNTLAGGEEGLKQMAAEARALGISISRVDAAQIEAANDAVTRAGGVFKGLGNQLAVAFSPIIGSVADSFRQSALDSAEFGNVGQRAAGALVRAFGFVRDIIHVVRGLILTAMLRVAEFEGTVLEFGNAVTPVFQEIIDNYNAMADTFVGRKLGLEPITQSAAQALEELKQKSDENISAIQDKLNEFASQNLPSDNINDWFENLKAKSREAAEVVAANAPSKVIRELQDQSSLVDETQERTDAARALAEFEKKTAQEKTTFALAQAGKLTEGLAKKNKAAFMANKAFAIGEAIMNTYAGATKALASYPPPFNYIAAAATVASGMANVSQIRAQSFEGGGFTGVGARAGGLDGKGGYMAMVHPNETIIDHTKKQPQQQQPVNVSFNVNANDSKGFDELLNSRRGLIVSLVNQAMNDVGRRGIA